MAEVTFVAETSPPFRHFRHMSFLYFLRECIFFEKGFRVLSIMLKIVLKVTTPVP